MACRTSVLFLALRPEGEAGRPKEHRQLYQGLLTLYLVRTRLQQGQATTAAPAPALATAAAGSPVAIGGGSGRSPSAASSASGGKVPDVGVMLGTCELQDPRGLMAAAQQSWQELMDSRAARSTSAFQAEIESTLQRLGVVFASESSVAGSFSIGKSHLCDASLGRTCRAHKARCLSGCRCVAPGSIAGDRGRRTYTLCPRVCPWTEGRRALAARTHGAQAVAAGAAW